MIKNKFKSGFTLIETLVYVFIFVLLTTGALSLIFSLEELFSEYRLKEELLNSGTMTMERILLEVREADSVSLAGSALATSTGVLTLNKGGDIIKFSRSSGDLVMLENGATTTSFVNGNVTLMSDTYYHYVTGEVELVSVVLHLRATIAGEIEDWEIRGSAILRGSYDET